VACRVSRDANGVTYHIPEVKVTRTPRGVLIPGRPAVDVWWARDMKKKSDEVLLIRQEEEGATKADVIGLLLAQVYDLHHALGCAIMRP